MRRVVAEVLPDTLHKQLFVLKAAPIVVELQLCADIGLQIGQITLIKTALEKFCVFGAQCLMQRFCGVSRLCRFCGFTVQAEYSRCEQG